MDTSAKSEEQKIIPRSEWNKLSVNQLYDNRNKLMDLYYNMRGASATFAEQYKKFIAEIDALIKRREQELLLDQEREREANH